MSSFYDRFIVLICHVPLVSENVVREFWDSVFNCFRRAFSFPVWDKFLSFNSVEILRSRNNITSKRPTFRFPFFFFFFEIMCSQKLYAKPCKLAKILCEYTSEAFDHLLISRCVIRFETRTKYKRQMDWICEPIGQILFLLVLKQKTWKDLRLVWKVSQTFEIIIALPYVTNSARVVVCRRVKMRKISFANSRAN